MNIKNILNSSKQNKGFTIIELIVVIVIIAVLATIVLVIVTGYISKGRDAGTRSDLATMLINGSVYYDGVGNFGLFIPFTGVSTGTIAANSVDANCGTVTGFSTPCLRIKGPNGGSNGYAITVACGTGAAAADCQLSTVQNWCAQVTLKAGGTYCVDSQGQKKLGTCTTTGAATGKCG